MFVRAEGRLDDGLALGGHAQAFLLEKIHKPPLGALAFRAICGVCHDASIKPANAGSQFRQLARVRIGCPVRVFTDESSKKTTHETGPSDAWIQLVTSRSERCRSGVCCPRGCG